LVDLFANPQGPINAMTRFGVGTFTYQLPIANLGDEIDLYYWSSAYTQVNPGDVAAHSNFTLSANYFNTVLEQVQLFDAQDNPISAWTLQDTISGRPCSIRAAASRLSSRRRSSQSWCPNPPRWPCWVRLAGLGFSRRKR
jgi:hypothetical protein